MCSLQKKMIELVNNFQNVYIFKILEGDYS